jgi:hypothetical protein
MDFPHLVLPSFLLFKFAAPHDLFAPLPTSVYDPSAMLLPTDFAGKAFSEEVKKEEAGTEPTYILQEPPNSPSPTPAKTGNTKKRPTKKQP